MKSFQFFLAIFIGIVFLGTAKPSFAVSQEKTFSLKFGGGTFVPYDGKSGFLVMGGLSFPASLRILVEGEMEFREFQTKFLGVRGVDVHSVSLRGLLKILLNPEGFTPYAGAGFSTSVNIVDTGKIERERPGVDVFNKVGFGSGLFGLLGVLIPATQDISFFAEGRVGIDIQLTHLEESDVENLGGFSGIGGLVFRF